MRLLVYQAGLISLAHWKPLAFPYGPTPTSSKREKLVKLDRLWDYLIQFCCTVYISLSCAVLAKLSGSMYEMLLIERSLCEGRGNMYGDTTSCY